jgi:Peptidase family M28
MKSTENEIQESLLKNLNDISFPRLVGTEGEKKAQKLIKQKITDLGYDVHTEPVPSSFFRINHLQSLSNIVIAILFFFLSFFYSIHPLLFLIPLVLIIIILFLVSTGSIEMSQPPNVPKQVTIKNTENIWAENNQTKNSKEPMNIVYMGHYDSKSTRFTGAQRIIFYLSLLLSALIVLGLGFIGIITYYVNSERTAVIETIMWVFSGIGMIAGFLLALNTVGDKSPGASDNGTAVAILLELMKFFKANPLENVNFTILFTAAEEVGLTGAFNFIKNRKDDPKWDRRRTFVINYDLAGAGAGPVLVNTGIGIPKRETSKIINTYIREISKEQDFPLEEAYLPIGGWHDGLPFTFYGYETTTIIGKSLIIHSSKDVVENIDIQSFYNSYLLGIEIAKKIITNS